MSVPKITDIRFSTSGVDERAYVNPTVGERLQNYSELPALLLLSTYHFFRVLIITLLTKPAAIFRFSDLRAEAFGNTWLAMAGGDPTQGPLKDMVPLMGTATGVILEIGPGDGRQVKYFTNAGIKAIYGAEPCLPLHSALKASVEAAGLSGKYHVLASGAERNALRPALKDIGLVNGEEGVFDTIICSKVLCSIPNPKDTIDSLYGLLKPGGRLLVAEHVKNPWMTRKGSIPARAVQILCMLAGWTFFMGGCHLNRATGATLKAAADEDGGWEKENLESLVNWGTLPWVFGEMVKKS